eukprot:282775_1
MFMIKMIKLKKKWLSINNNGFLKYDTTTINNSSLFRFVKISKKCEYKIQYLNYSNKIEMKWIGLNETKSDDIDSKEDDIGLKLMDSSIFSVDFAARFYIDYVSDKVPFSGDGKTIYNIKCIQQSKNNTYYLSKNTTKPFKIGFPTSTLFKKIDSNFVLEKNVNNKDTNNEFYVYDNFDENKDALTIFNNNLKFLNKSQTKVDEKSR